MRLASSLLFLLSFAATASAASPTRLAPSGNWSLNYGESCQLSRTFGTGDYKSSLVLERVAPDQSMTMLVMGRVFSGPNVANDYEAAFLPAKKVRALYGAAARSADGTNQPAILWPAVTFIETGDLDSLSPGNKRELLRAMKDAGKRQEIDPAHQEQMHQEEAANSVAATAIEISRKSDLDVILDTGSMGGVYKMMEQCANDQLTAWGIDPSIEKRIAKRPFARRPGDWFSWRDYPPESFLRSQNSELRVRALISANGRVTRCTPLTFVGDESYMRKVCDVMTARARFEPAELADGTKVPSYYIQRIAFVR